MSTTLTFDPGQTSKTVAVQTTEDTTDEEDETFTLTLSSPSNATLTGDVTQLIATGTITDNDAVPALIITGESALEDSNVTFTVTLMPVSGRMVTVRWGMDLSDRTAEQADFVGTSLQTGSVTFAPGETTAQFEIAVFDDAVDEDDETFDVNLGSATNARIEDNDATGTIEDNDAPPILSVVKDMMTVIEDDQDVSLTVNLSAASEKQVRFKVRRVAGADDTASEAEDLLNPAEGAFATIAPGTTSFTVSRSYIRPDTLDEPDETFTLEIHNIENATLADGATTKRVTITIEDDDDPPKIAIGRVIPEPDEGDGEIGVPVTLSAASGKEVSAIWYVDLSGHTAESEDFDGDLSLSAARRVVFSPGSTSERIQITLADDMIDERDETFKVILSSLQNTTYQNNEIVVTIRDNDDPPVVTLAPAPLSFSEDGGSTTVTATLANLSSEDTTVTVSATPVSPAVAGDFDLSVNRTLTIVAGQTTSTGTVTLDAVNNGTDAPDKSVRLSAMATNRVGVAGDPADVTVTIEDDEAAPTATLTLSAETINENNNGAAQVSVALSHPSSEATTVTVSAAAQNTQGIAGDPDDVTLTITDDENAPTVTLSLSASTIGENDGFTGVAVELSHPSSEDTVVTVSAMPVSPAVAADFTQIGSVLTVAALETKGSGSVEVKANDNDVDAPDKQVTISAAAVNTQGVAGDPAALTLTIEDDDERGFVWSPVAMTLSEVEGGTYMVALTSQPTAAVTLTVTTLDQDRLFLSDPTTLPPHDFTYTLTFTQENWARPQTIGLVPRPDADAVENTVVLRHAATGGGYRGVSGDYAVTINDADRPSVNIGLSVNPEEVPEDGDAVELRVTARLDGGVLSSPASVMVTVGAGTAEAAEFTADPASFTLRIAAGNSSASRTVTLTPVDDDLVEEPETVTVTGTTTATQEGTMTVLKVIRAEVRIADDDTRGVTVSADDPLIVAEGGNPTSYTVMLDSEPTGNVTVTPEVTGNTDVTVTPEVLTFTTSNWDMEQTVMVSAAHDDDTADDAATVTHTVAGADYGPNGVTAAPVAVTVEDDDTQNLTVSVSALTVPEGRSDTYTVVLDFEPTGTVTVRPSVADNPDVTVMPLSLQFTSSNWSTAQTVTVSAREDADSANDTATVSHAVPGAPELTEDKDNVAVTVVDGNQASTTIALSVFPLEVSEDDGTTMVTVTAALDRGALTADTVVNVAVRGGTASVTDFGADPAVLVLTIRAGTIEATGTFRLTPVDDSEDEGDGETVAVTGTTTATQQGTMTVLVVTGAEVRIADDDTRGVTVSAATLAVDEESSATYTVVLDSAPTGPVTVTPSVTDNPDVTVSPVTLEFNSTNWSTAQTVTVTAGEDTDASDDRATVEHTVADADYGANGVTAASVSVSVTDDDTASTRIALTLSPVEVMEGEGRQTVTVMADLDSATSLTPTDVTVTVTDGTAMSTADFDAVPDFTVTILAGDTVGTGMFELVPVDDRIDEDAGETVTVRGSAAGLVVTPVELTINDNDERGLMVSVTELSVDEQGSATYTVALDTEPTGEVTVRPAVTGNPNVSAMPATLTFDASDWDQAKIFTVSAAHDDDAINDSAELDHTATGADYAGVTAEAIAITVVDNNPRVVRVSKALVTLREGGEASYAVVLETEPTGTVTVTPTVVGNTDVMVSPVELEFTTRNWDRPQTVTVSSGHDDDMDPDSATVTHAVTGADYEQNGVTAKQVSVEVSDDDIASTVIVLELSQDTVPERRLTRLTVTGELNGAPRGEATVVTLTLEAGTAQAEDFAAIEPVTLTISAGEVRGSAQVSLTPVADEIDEDDGESLTIAAITGSGLELHPEQLTVTIEDDDTRGLRLSRTSLSVTEEGSTSYTVALRTQPTKAVTVTPLVRGNLDVTVSPEILEFDSTNWQTAQPVMVAAASDPDSDAETATVIHVVSGGDYSGVEANLPVTVDDIDQPSRSVQLTVAPDRVEEVGPTVELKVTAMLDGAARSAATAIALEATGGTATSGTDFEALTGVVVTIPANATEGSVTFGFTPVDDSVDEGLSETVILGGTVEGLTVRTATLTIADDDGRGIELPQGPVTLEENGKTTYPVALATQPTGAVTVRVTVSGNRDVTVEPSSLAFTADNWNVEQTVTVSAAHDDDAANDAAQLRHAASGADYRGVTALPLAVTVTDNDTRGVTVEAADPLEFREGGSAAYTVVLVTQPTGTVTVTPTVTGDADVTVSPARLSFTTSSWNREQTVTVRAGQDGDQTADMATVEHAVTGADYGEENVTAAAVEVTVTDDDMPSTKVTLTVSPDTVTENGGAKRLTVTAELDASPESVDTVVTLTVTTGAAEAASATLTIPMGQVSATAVLTLTPIDNAIDAANTTIRVNASTTSSLTLNPPSLTVTITDDDERGVTVSVAVLTVREGPDGASYTVVLGSQPTSTVTVRPTPPSPPSGANLTISPSSLSFSTSDWSTPQTVTVTAGEDSDVEEDAVIELAHTVSGGDYDVNNVMAASVTVTVPGFEEDGVTVQLRVPMSGDLVVTVPEGTSAPAGTRVTLPSGLAGKEIEIRMVADSDPALTDPPRGFRAGDAAVDITGKSGTELTFSGEAIVCLPASSGSQRVHRYDEDATPPEWVELEPPAEGSPPGLACGVTDSFSFFALGSAPVGMAVNSWLSRFGRTVAEQVVDMVTERLRSPREAGTLATLAGRGIGAPVAQPAPDGLPAGIGEAWDVDREAWSRSMTARELLAGTSFTITGGEAAGGSVAVWGRVAHSRFDGREDEASVGGEVMTVALGMDRAAGPWTWGVSLAHSEGRGTHALEGRSNRLETSLTGLYPFVGYRSSERLSLWGVAGYGEGDLTLTLEGGESRTTGLKLAMAATGARGELLSDGDGFQLSLETDALFVRTASDGAEDLAAAEADASRLRFGLEASWALATESGAHLRPAFEVGLRHDGGDAETGMGVDIGSGIEWDDPALGFTVDLNAHGLLVHEASGFAERGISGSLLWDRDRSSERGLEVTVRQSLGTAASSDLLGRRTMAGLVRLDDGDSVGRLDAKLGYGLPVLGNRFTGTPWIGVGLSGSGQDYTMGWRFRPSAAAGFDMGVEASHRKTANDNEPEYGIAFRLTARW